MTLSKNNLFVLYYKFVYSSTPLDICSLFWGIVYASLLAPFVVPGRTAVKNVVGATFLGAIMWIMAILLTALGFVIWDKHFPGILENIAWYWAVPIAFTTAILGFSLLIAIFVGIVYFFFGFLPKTRVVTKLERGWSNTVDVVGAVRGKYCTKINYKD